MKTRIQSTIRSSGVAAVASLVLGCAQLSQTSLTAFGRSTEPDNIVALAAVSKDLAVTSRTMSRALDRIDQRNAGLDETYNHMGSGRGVTVYVFDGGISTTHPELAGRVRLGYTAFPNDPKICNAHGTAVAGAIAGGGLGVAPDAEIVDVKMVGCTALRGTINAIVEATKWVINDHAVRGGPAIANWSFIADTLTEIPALDSAVTRLRQAGITVIVSAGNYDLNACRVSPANAEGTFVVGAASFVPDSVGGTKRWVDRRTEGTAWGPCIDIYAPGDSVLLPSLTADFKPITQLWSGTSMATGYVSGAAALFLQLRPKATPDEVADYLRRTATANAIGDARSPFPRLLYVGPPDRASKAKTFDKSKVDLTWIIQAAKR